MCAVVLELGSIVSMHPAGNTMPTAFVEHVGEAVMAARDVWVFVIGTGMALSFRVVSAGCILL